MERRRVALRPWSATDVARFEDRVMSAIKVRLVLIRPTKPFNLSRAGGRSGKVLRETEGSVRGVRLVRSSVRAHGGCLGVERR